ncbi:hypothetical protein K438DRAFT_1765289 [Mycena galopus ATCC 62051]|nr:hypothetical protein K438DRAFT_1765289 [Mycena galopus ATCC 62051]
MAAAKIEGIWGKYTSPIFCPHTTRSGQRYEPLVLRRSGQHEGRSADYYRALSDHQCTYRVIIPRLRPSNKILVTWEDREAHEAEEAGQREKNDDQEDDDDYRPSQTSTSSSLSAGYGGPRMMSPLRPTPTMIGAGTVFAGAREKKSYYMLKVANARRISDVASMEYIHQLSASGLLEAEEPDYHPASDLNNPPLILMLYDQRIYSNCLDKTFAHLDYLYKPLGQVIRDMNCVLGATFGDYAVLIRSSRPCSGCSNHFSPDGHERHREDGICTNHPDLSPVEACAPFDGEIRYRTFRDNKHPEFKGETLDTPIGAALLEWNSRLGVPADVWIMVSTAVIHCSTCDLTRTFPAHAIHLKDGVCGDPGQAIVAASPSD